MNLCFLPRSGVKSVQGIDPFQNLCVVRVGFLDKNLKIFKKDRSGEQIYHGNKNHNAYDVAVRQSRFSMHGLLIYSKKSIV